VTTTGSATGPAEPFLAWLRRAVPLDLEGWSVGAGLRAALACALPVLLGEIHGMREFSWIAIVAFWACLADQGGAWRTRLAAMGAFTVFAALGCLVATLIKPFLWLAVVFAWLWCFGGGLVRIYGNAASSVGVLLSVAVLVALGMPGTGWAEARSLAGLTMIAGSGRCSWPW
jgi:hypothetical protein